jgi:hypothetical protein
VLLEQYISLVLEHSLFCAALELVLLTQIEPVSHEWGGTQQPFWQLNPLEPHEPEGQEAYLQLLGSQHLSWKLQAVPPMLQRPHSPQMQLVAWQQPLRPSQVALFGHEGLLLVQAVPVPQLLAMQQ